MPHRHSIRLVCAFALCLSSVVLASGVIGTWSLVSTPSTGDNLNNYFRDVSCISSSDCWTVGQAALGNVYQTLTEHWDGHAWSIVASPNTSTTQGQILWNVDCIATNNCWAVGDYDNTITGAYQTLAEHWNGSAWSIVASPNSDTASENALYGVACAAPNDCWAVGYHAGTLTPITNTDVEPLTEHWDGNAWTLVTSPNTSVLDEDILANVTCTSTSNCWAVGYFLSTSQIFQTLIEHWDGSAWTIVTSPNTDSAQDNLLKGVVCLSPNDCWAAGHSGDQTTGVYKTLVEHWNGTGWSIVASPNTDANYSNYFYGITCTSTSDCWAAGSYDALNGASIVTHNLVEHWDGTSWSIVTVPNESETKASFLYTVDCSSARDCLAVGARLNDANKVQTVGLHYAVAPPALKIVSIDHPTAGHCLIGGQTTPLATINIETSPDMIAPFTFLGTTTADASGNFQYDDINLSGATKKFYRATYP